MVSQARLTCSAGTIDGKTTAQNGRHSGGVGCGTWKKCPICVPTVAADAGSQFALSVMNVATMSQTKVAHQNHHLHTYHNAKMRCML